MARGDNPGKMGRPSHVRDEAIARQVRALSAVGLSSVDCARVIGKLSGPTLLKHYLYEYEAGSLEAIANVGQSLYRAATNKQKPNVVACIFFLKCRAGWNENGTEAPGKKEAAELLAKVADKGTDWEGLLDPQ
jgi:hypothetical protein